MTIPEFRRLVWAFYKKQGRRTLPWRHTKNPYHILVSEVMLQQTQVDRVIPFYKNFLTQFPTAKKLANAPLSRVLKAWQGLGYNRRARMLQAAARELAKRKITTVDELHLLPGVGPYTARAVAAFAWNRKVVFVETNIRTVVIHHFFSRLKQVSDRDILAILERALPKGRSREWYSALMDYGAFLKRSGVNVNGKVRGAVKQKPFKGSNREARGAIVRKLSQGNVSKAVLVGLLGSLRKDQLTHALDTLLKEGLVQMRSGWYTLAD